MKNYRRRTIRRKLSPMGLILLTILVVVLIGDLVGALMYLRQSQEMQAALAEYVTGHIDNQGTFFQIFVGQMRYQLTIWGLGATIIGNFVNVFLIFTRGVSAGFNLTFLFNEVGFFHNPQIVLLWLIQHLLVLLVMMINVYFSLRFGYIFLKSLAKGKLKQAKKHGKIYLRQLVVIVILTLVTSTVSTLMTPNISEHVLMNTQHQEYSDYTMD